MIGFIIAVAAVVAVVIILLYKIDFTQAGKNDEKTKEGSEPAVNAESLYSPRNTEQIDYVDKLDIINPANI